VNSTRIPPEAIGYNIERDPSTGLFLVHGNPAATCANMYTAAPERTHFVADPASDDSGFLGFECFRGIPKGPPKQAIVTEGVEITEDNLLEQEAVKEG
jgi:hypothetical protein